MQAQVPQYGETEASNADGILWLLRRPKVGRIADPLRRLLLSCLMLTGFHIAVARQLDEELVKEKKSLVGIARLRADGLERESAVRARLLKAPPDTKEAKDLQGELEEIQRMLQRIPELQASIEAHMKQIESLQHLLDEIGKDPRRPTKADVSGSWRSDSLGVGYVIQLEQRGGAVQGRGYYWGCLGTFGPFDITGSYQDGTLSLTFSGGEFPEQKHVYRYRQEDAHPRFEIEKGNGRDSIVPVKEKR